MLKSVFLSCGISEKGIHMEWNWKLLFINCKGTPSLSSRIMDLADNLLLKYMFIIHLLGCIISKLFLDTGFQDFRASHMLIVVMSVWGLFSLWAFCTDSLQRSTFYLAALLVLGSTFIIQPLFTFSWVYVIAVEMLAWGLFIGTLIMADVLNSSLQRVRWWLLSLLIVCFTISIFYFIGIRHFVAASIIPLLILLDTIIIWWFTVLAVQQFKIEINTYIGKWSQENRTAVIEDTPQALKLVIFKYMSLCYVNFIALLVMVGVFSEFFWWLVNSSLQRMTGQI